MQSLEESIHQVFSSILGHTRSKQTITFEEESFRPSRGIFNSSDIAILDGSTGLIGTSHPLYIKSALQSALSGKVIGLDSSRDSVVKLLEDFLSKIIGEKVYLTNPTESFNPCDLRVPELLTSSSLENFKNGSPITLEGLLPETIAIQNSKPKNHSFFGIKSDFNLRFSKALIRFLDLGQFYGRNGLIKNRELQLKESLSTLECVSSISGLLVRLEKSYDLKHIVPFQNTLIFPTSFDNDQVLKVRTFLEDECLS